MELTEFFEFQDEIYVKSKRIMYNAIESVLPQNSSQNELFNQLMSKIKKLDCVYDKNIYYYRTITKLLHDPFLLKFENICEKIIEVFTIIHNYIIKISKKKNALLSFAIADLNNIDYISHFPEEINDYVLSFILIPKNKRVINKDGYKQLIKFKNEYNVINVQYNLIFQILIKYLDFAQVKSNDVIIKMFDKLYTIKEKVNLINACRNDDIESAKKILDDDLYVKFNTYDGKSIFDIPINNESDKFIKFLISYEEIDLYINDSKKRIPIKNAYDLINKSVFNILMDRMIDSYTYKAGMRTTLLIWAISNGDKEVCRYVLSERKVKNINLADSNDRTALIWAIKKKNRDVVDTLLAYPNIDIHLCDKYGNTPLLLSAIHEDIITMKRLIKDFGADINIKNSFGNTPLIIATDKKFIDIAILLINHKDIDINASNNNKITALMYAIFKDCDEIIYQIFKHPELDINAIDNKGNSVLMLASKKGNIKLIKAILNIPNVNINILNYEKKTALVYSIEKNMFKAMELLLQQKDIMVNTKDINGDTPLISYIKLNVQSKMEYLKILLKSKKLDINAVDGDMRTALIISCEKNLYTAVKQIIKVKGVNYNLQDKYKNTALIFAAINRNPDIIKMLTDISVVDVNICNNIGKTALMLSIKDARCVQILLKRKDINVNLRDRKGRTAFYIAIEKKCIESAKHLLKHRNMNPGIKDSKGVSPYDLAIRYNYNELAEIILKLTNANNSGKKNSVISSSDIKLIENSIKERNSYNNANNNHHQSVNNNNNNNNNINTNSHHDKDNLNKDKNLPNINKRNILCGIFGIKSKTVNTENHNKSNLIEKSAVINSS